MSEGRCHSRYMADDTVKRCVWSAGHVGVHASEIIPGGLADQYYTWETKDALEPEALPDDRLMVKVGQLYGAGFITKQYAQKLLGLPETAT